MTEQFQTQSGQADWRAFPQYGPPAQPPQPAYPPQQQAAWHPSHGYAFPPQVVIQQQASNGVGTAGFVCGLLGLIFCWVPFFGIVLGLLGIVLGGAGMSSGRRTGAGTGLAITGLILGIISLIPAIAVIAALSSV